MAAEQDEHDPQMHSDHRPARNLDPVDLILLLLSLIILLNLGINVMILIWRSFTRYLQRTFDFFQPKGKIPKKPQLYTKKPVGVPTLCIHCTLDPVALNVVRPTSTQHRRRQHSESCHGSYWGSQRGSQRGSRHRRNRHHSGHLQYHHHPRTYLNPPPPPPSPATSPTSFCQETWDTDLDDNKEPWNQQSNCQLSWKTTSHPGNIRHYRGYWRSYYPMSSNLSSQDLRAPRRVEAKSELRLETYYQPSPNSWPQNLKENMESSPIPTSPQFIPKLPPNPSWIPGTHNPFPQGGQIFYDGWEVRQKVQDGNRGADVSKTPPSVPRSPEPHSYAENVVPKQTVRHITGPLISSHPTLNRTHVSAGHLPFSSWNRPEIKRWDREHGEQLPHQSPSFSRLPSRETQSYCGSVPKEKLIPEVSQPLSYGSACVPIRVPAPDSSRVPAFIPLSRNPGGLTNYPVYDSQELKRQIQEGRGHRETRLGG
ncbi:uncharacterized protein SPEM2 [Macrotis lagotis]|uniref:uncharacterized protein SPEM2 n=1 Tax=Macrotis lagotis TaxID=92651 RepID=UPI003D68C622